MSRSRGRDGKAVEEEEREEEWWRKRRKERSQILMRKPANNQYDHENNENDVILNFVAGSDPDEEDELEHVIVIPRLKTVTRH